MCQSSSSEYDSLQTSATLLGRLRCPTDDSQFQRDAQNFVNRYHPLVMRWCEQYHGMSACDADAIAGDVMSAFLQEMREAFEYDAKKSFRGWLSYVTKNVVRQFRRSQAKQGLLFSEVFQEEKDINNFVATLEDAFSEACREELLQTAFSRLRRALTEYEQTVYTMGKVEGLSCEEIAEKLGKTTHAVEEAMSRAVKKFKQIIEQLSAEEM